MLKNLFGLIILLFIFDILILVNGHGRLIEPPSRASAWRYGFDTPHNYNDHELFCGGFTRQWQKNGGKCGVCGDAWDIKLPRPHEYGGTYGQGVIVRNYNAGGIINIRVELTASHAGFFQFSICPNYINTTEECLESNVLKIVKPQDGKDHDGTKYYPMDGNKVYEMKYRLPKINCQHCILQWKYISGNNWGNCPNGTGAIGCGPQEEFRACADITIVGKGVYPITPTTTTELEEETTQHTSTTTTTTTPISEETYSPISTLVITLISFLVVFLIFFLLYFHYYQLGKQIKNWIKSKPDNNKAQNVQNTPRPPPRTKRRNNSMHEIDLRFNRDDIA